MSKVHGIHVRGTTLLALRKLYEVESQGESPFDSRSSINSVAAEIFEVAVIERFEKTFGMSVQKYLSSKGLTLPEGNVAPVARPCTGQRNFPALSSGESA